ncbi:MAG: hypothetical protein JXJ04_04675 [Spirochaetales bacterium]|nr:hypothetical protein [Spirochaetales bacterium]
MKFNSLIYIILFLFLPYYTIADITIEIEYPEIEIPDIEALEDEINIYFEDFIDYVENDIKKKETMKGFSEANAFTHAAISYPAINGFKAISFCLNLSAAGQLFSIDYDEIISTMENTTIEEDIYLGFGFQPFTCSLEMNPGFFFPSLPDYFTRLNLGLHIGGASFLYLTYPLFSFNIGLFASYAFRPEQQLFKMLTWNPLKIYTGVSFFYNEITFPFAFDLELPISLDGPGPIGEITGDVIIPFTPEASLKSETFVLPLGLMTSFQVGWFFSLDMGCGFDLLLGRAYISIEDEAEISLSGEIATYTESTGKVIINGHIHESNPDFLRARMSIAFGFDFDPLRIKIPFVYYFDNGISAGIKIGISY